jgi:alkanesulfonate monooxygenase SsuD/methylene tetrahydromethanopterin reductase-like flavin-dependent oxidoreductase (luciferase family)
MEIGIGIPNHVAGVAGGLIAPWARQAEERGFQALTTIDRLIYPSVDSVVALAVAAGATTTPTLVTNVLLAPLYPPVVLAKQLASLAECSTNRLVLGLGVGNRRDDYAATGVEFDRRGKILDEQVVTLRRAWSGESFTDDIALCPGAVAIPLLFGGKSAATVRRATTGGDGWAGGALRDYPAVAAMAERIRAGWQAAGRQGEPIMQMSVNFALGAQDTVRAGRDHLTRYYGFNPQFAALNAADMVGSGQDARDTVQAFRDMGFDRLLFHPAVASMDQVERLADAVL